MKKVISVANVRINSEDYSIVSGSFEYDDGLPERTVKNTDGRQVVYSEDMSTAIGMMKFTLPSTQDNLDSILKFQRLGAISCSVDDGGDFSRAMLRGVCKNDEGKKLGSDSDFTVTIEGDPLT